MYTFLITIGIISASIVFLTIGYKIYRLVKDYDNLFKSL